MLRLTVAVVAPPPLRTSPDRKELRKILRKLRDENSPIALSLADVAAPILDMVVLSSQCQY